MLPEIPDFVALIKRAAVDPELRRAAGLLFGQTFAGGGPLTSEHGAHLLRFSNFGGCSAALVAGALGLNDVARTDDTQLAMLDAGTLQGAWLACLLKAGLEAQYGLEDGKCDGVAVHLEYPALYCDTPGHIDLLLVWCKLHQHEPVCVPSPCEVIEIKTTPSSGELKAPDAKKLMQCLQAAGYALGVADAATYVVSAADAATLRDGSPVRAGDTLFAGCERFTVITFGANVGNNRAGVPHPKLRADTYSTADYKPLVDAEVDRLTALAALTEADLLRDLETLADTADDFRCRSCLWSKCFRNKNEARFEL